MKINLLLILCVFLNLNCVYGQESGIGLNYTPLLSVEESEFLEKYFESQKTGF
jgi:hypothetical protein